MAAIWTDSWEKNVIEQSKRRRVYLVTYDVSETGGKSDKAYQKEYRDDRKKIIDTIKLLGPSHYLATTTYLVKTDFTHEEIRKKFNEIMEDKDKLVICEIKEDNPTYMAGNLTEEDYEWLDNHFNIDPQ